MKIAIALGGTDLGRSGLGVYTRAMIPRLVKRAGEDGGSVTLIGTPTELDAYAEVGAGAERRVVASQLQSAAVSALWHLLLLGRVAKSLDADVLLLPAANRRAAVLSAVPTVGVVHDLAPLRVKRRYDPLRMFYGRYCVVEALRRTTQLVSVSELTQRDAAEATKRDPSTVKVVPNGVDYARFAMPDDGDEGDGRVEDARERLDLREPYLLYLSRLEHPGKNHLRLLRAFAQSELRRSHRIALAGPDWGAQEAIVSEAERLGISDRLSILGYLPDDVVPGLVGGADAVLMLGLYEGFGLPALEALAAGRPVVASNTGALPEVVGELAALCDPTDESAIQRALERAIHDADLRARCHTQGPERARARSWDKSAQSLYEICARVARVARDEIRARVARDGTP